MNLFSLSSAMGSPIRTLPILLSLVGFFFAASSNQAQAPDQATHYEEANLKRLVALRERLTYRAYYGFLTLGDAVVEQYRDTTYKGQRRRLVKTIVKSNPKLLIAGNKEEHFTSIIASNDQTVYDLMYWKDDIDDRKFKMERYEYDYAAKKVTAWKEKGQPVVLPLVGPSISGPAVIYHTRLLAGTGKSVKIPIYINQKLHYILMKDHQRTEKVENKTFGRTHEEAWYVDGDAQFDGPFGFSGKFKGWVLKDRHENVPLEGHVKVWVGSIKVVLVKYEVI